MRDSAKEAAFKHQFSLHTASLKTLKNKVETIERIGIRVADRSGVREAQELYLVKRESVRCASEALNGFRTVVNRFGHGDMTEDVVDGIMREADELLHELVEQIEKTRKVVDEDE
jgi:NADH:ubiquinone oxidoreductase subunit D